MHPQYKIDNSSPSTATAPKLTQKKLDLRPLLSEKRKREIMEKIAEFVALDMRLVNVVEGEGFKELMRAPEPRYTAPKRETVMHEVNTKYTSTRAEISKLINKCEAVSITTDIWTSLQMEAYLTVTAHFTTEDWYLECFVLETKKMEESHTAEHISQTLTEITSDWDIPGLKRVSVVHCNRSVARDTLYSCALTVR